MGNKPECDCDERITISDAGKLIADEKADWLKTEKADGTNYIYRGAIVARMNKEEIRVVRKKGNRQHKKNLKTRRKGFRDIRMVGKVSEAIRKFRRVLTDQENLKWTDDEILEAFHEIDTNEDFVAGIGAKEQIDATLKCEKRKGNSLITFLGSQEFQSLQDANRIHKGLKDAAIFYYNTCLAREPRPSFSGSVPATYESYR